MPSPARTADEITDNIRSLVDRIVDAKLTQEWTKRGQELADTLAERGNEAWRDSRPMRRDAAKRVSRAANDTTRWSSRTWRKSLLPALDDLWKRRTLAVGAAGAAIPAGREIVDSAAQRLGLKQREERHWGAFFLGLLLGAAAGAVVAMLTTPKRGSEMRRELGVRADEIATKAKDEWVPMFQREETTGTTNGHGVDALPGESLSGAATANLQEGAAAGGAASGDAAEMAASETADAINDAYDGVDREPTV
ncbi:MAG TPA: YtxH domain-containing protein [Candidatus Limnocylindria bacterium]|nr:YtxH domain-containing protein [Candidatus Limnocylindria bacterium]